MFTTLNKIKAWHPCGIERDADHGYRKLVNYLGKGYDRDAPIKITTILDSNGLEDALWCLRAVDGYDRGKRLYAVACARWVEKFTADHSRVKNCNDVSERYANGLATEDELRTAEAAAYAAWAAAGAWAAAAAWAGAEAWAAAAARAAGAWAAAGVAWAGGAEREWQSAELRRMCAEIEAGRDPYPVKQEA